MSPKTFLLHLAAVTAGTAALLAVLYFLAPAAQPHGRVMILTILLFVVVCTGLYYAGRSAANSSSKLAFNNIVSISVFGKMVLAVAVLFVYQQTAKPTNEWFVGVFLSVYVIYTVFEVWFMTKLARG